MIARSVTSSVPNKDALNSLRGPDHWVALGQLGSPYGLYGWLRLSSFTQPASNLLSYSSLWLAHQAEWRSFGLEQGQPHGNRFIVKLEGIDNRECAAQYTNCAVAVPRSTLPQLPESEHYWADVVGMTVVMQTGDHLGQVKSVIEAHGHDIFVLDGERERLIPYLDETVISIDEANRMITVNWDASF